MRVIRMLAFAFGRYNRERKANFALEIAERLGVQSALLVGVSDQPGPVNNVVEARIAAHVPYTVASGLGLDGSGEWTTYVVADGLQLPFRDRSFDLVYANAVIEHVGDEDAQRILAREAARVGKVWIITTPNRWFPIEAHYHTLFSHWSSWWAPKGTVTRLLGIRDLRRLVPSGVVRGTPFLSPTLTAIGTSQRRSSEREEAVRE